jgi:neutral ceramidase
MFMRNCRYEILIRTGLYTEANFALVGTHSHSGVGGFLNNLLPQLTSLGFVKQTYDAIVNGMISNFVVI